LVGQIFADQGRLDYLFNNAGIAATGDAAHYTLESWRKVVEVNVMGVVHGAQAAYPAILRQGFGHIVNIASTAGLLPTPSLVSYAASKHAVVGLSRALRAEAQSRGVRVSVVCPGVIRTPMLQGGKVLPGVVPVSEDHERFAIPTLIVLAILAAGYVRSFVVASFLRRQQFTLCAAVLLLSTVMAAACSHLLRAWFDAAALFLISVHTLNAYGILRMRFPWACGAGWGTAAIYLGYMGNDGMLAGDQLQVQAVALLFVNLFGMIVAYQFEQSMRREFLALRLLGQERERSERRLLNVLPAAIAERLKTSSDSIADHSAEVTVLFADIVGFTPLSAKTSPQELVRLLDIIFSEFDALASTRVRLLPV